METAFLVCFVFGALFALLSVVLGFAGNAWHVGHLPHAHLHDHAAGIHTGVHDGQAHADTGQPQLPIFNISAALAFLTWFGATGYLLTRFSAWPLFLVLLVALAAGLAGAVVIGLILRKIMAGERVMNPRDYQLEGTEARVTVSIPAGGVGEVIFTKGGTRRGEAARSLDGRAIPRGTEVVIIDYVEGVALVESWNQLLRRPEPEALGSER